MTNSFRGSSDSLSAISSLTHNSHPGHSRRRRCRQIFVTENVIIIYRSQPRSERGWKLISNFTDRGDNLLKYLIQTDKNILSRENIQRPQPHNDNYILDHLAIKSLWALLKALLNRSCYLCWPMRSCTSSQWPIRGPGTRQLAHLSRFNFLFKGN